MLVLFLLSRILFGGGGGGGTVDDGATAPTTVAGGGTPAPTPGGGPGATTPTTAVVETFEVFTTKNPFIPARGAIGSGSGGTGGGTTGGGTTATTIGGGTTGTTVVGGTTGTTRPGTTATTTPGQTGGTTATTAPSSVAAEPRRGDRVALLDVFVENGRTMANVRVNDTAYRVGEGDSFATSYRVVSLTSSSECGRFVFGDDQFRLCRGEEVVK